MTIQTYDYPASKEAHAKLVAAIEAFEANAKQVKEATDELIEGNNAAGVQSTMNSFKDKLDAQVKVLHDLRETHEGILANSKAYHVANGGEE